MIINANIYNLIQPVRSLYWRICKPKTFGVRVLITHPQIPENILLIRHTYGDKTLWNIPGGGYRPEKEKPEDAAKRETMEEVGLAVQNLKKIGEYQSNSEGKDDTVILFAGTITIETKIKTSPEIAEAIWVNYKTLTGRADIAKIAIQAIEDSLGVIVNKK